MIEKYQSSPDEIVSTNTDLDFFCKILTELANDSKAMLFYSKCPMEIGLHFKPIQWDIFLC